MDLREHLQSTLGDVYSIERELGGGGMSHVFVATDTSLGRRIVVKVLPSDSVAQVSIERFKREIRVAASLQHPHIVPVLSAGEVDGLPYFTMPYVKGESLRERLTKGGELSVGETVHILRDVAAALAYAHAEGVVHRDVKPDNIILSGGVAVVTDFGVAKAVDVAATEGGKRTAASGLTSMGVALGTPAYMSPEQATADPHVDHRADIYSFGCVAYEMLAGSSPFAGRPVQQLLAAHVTEKPQPVTDRRPNVPPAFAALVMRCLEKRAGDRPQSAQELLAALDAIATPSGGSVPTDARLAAVTARRRPWMVAAVSIAVVAIVAAAGWLAGRDAFAAPRPSLVIGRATQFTDDPGLQIDPAISPDGKLVAYAAGTSLRMRIFIRPAAGGRTFPLSDDSTAVETEPQWSPDGLHLLFRTRGGVSVAPTLGGSVRAIVAGGRSPVSTATWSPDGRRIAFARGESLYVADADGQSARLVAAAASLTHCRWSPDGTRIACVSGNASAPTPGRFFANIAPSRIVVARLAGGRFHGVTGAVSLNVSPEWSRNDRLLFISNAAGPRDIYELALTDGDTARVAPMRLTTGLDAVSLSMSPITGAVTYAVYTGRSNVWSVPIPASGVASAADATPVTSGAQIIEAMMPSPDGKWLVYDSNRDGTSNIYRVPIAGGEPEQLTRERFSVFAPSLSPDNTLLAYHSWRTGARNIEVKPLDGGPVEYVTSSAGQSSYPVWSPDGRRLVYFDQDAPFDISIVRRLGPGRWSAPVPRAHGNNPVWSPDGASVAYMQNGGVSVIGAESGPERALYRPRPGEPNVEQTVWSRDGRSIYFKTHDALGRALIYALPASGGTPRLVVRFPDPLRSSNRSDLAVDAHRLYFAIDDRQSNVWLADVTRR